LVGAASCQPECNGDDEDEGDHHNTSVEMYETEEHAVHTPEHEDWKMDVAKKRNVGIVMNCEMVTCKRKHSDMF
jgi:hypothetical protein